MEPQLRLSPVKPNNILRLPWRRLHHSMRCKIPVPVIIVLIWIFIASFVLNLPTQLFVNWTIDNYSIKMFITSNSIVAFLFCFYPFGGYLADTRFGRYKTVITSMNSLLIIFVVAVLVTTPWLVLQYYYTFASKVFQIVKIFWGVSMLPMIMFHTNAIPYCMDQIRDSPTDHQSLFIHWYVFAWYSGLLSSQIMIICNFSHPDAYYVNGTRHTKVGEKDYFNTLTYTIPIGSIISLLAASLLLANYKRQLFFLDSVRPSPYKLVKIVSKFAWQHKVPVRRSAFTYCEDGIPSGLDLGKTKYGGPFTTEQVEDVKAFYGILKVLFALGPVFFLYVAADRLLLNLFVHTKIRYRERAYRFELFLLGIGLITPLIIVVVVPLYNIFIRQLLLNYIPGMLKRVGLSIVLVTAALVCIFIIDTIGHAKQISEASCMLPQFDNSSYYFFNIDVNRKYTIIPRMLNSFSIMILYIALYEFICSQSPQNMKGMLIGLSFAIKGVFELLGIVSLLVFGELVKSTRFPSCGMYYYLMNIIVSIIVLLIYVYIAKSYQYRLRDEPCHVYQYAEEYYSKTPENILHSDP